MKNCKKKLKEFADHIQKLFAAAVAVVVAVASAEECSPPYTSKRVSQN